MEEEGPTIETQESEAMQNFNNTEIILNVGGKIFKASREVLTNEKDTFFSSLISFNSDKNQGSEYFIDRNNTFFELIVNHLKGIDVLPLMREMSELQLNLLREEVDFYCIKSLNFKSFILLALLLEKLLLLQFPPDVFLGELGTL